MPIRKKALYYGLMLLLTLLVIEGMARLAYYAAWGQWYSPVPAAAPADAPPARPAPRSKVWLVGHPFYGHTLNQSHHALNAMPPLQRREDMVIIALLGGSIADEVQPFLEIALRRYFAAHNLPRQPVIREFAIGGERQPQQTLILANALLLGGEFDLIINLDGVNDIAGNGNYNPYADDFPFFSDKWARRVGLTAAEVSRAGRIALLRREQSRLRAAAAAPALRRSAVFGLVARYRRERAAAQIIQRNHDLAAAQSAYSLEKHGPRPWWNSESQALPAIARLWYRSSLTLAQLAQLAGADYYHFLQPNQYVPDSKPLSAAEQATAWDPSWPWLSRVAPGYPLMQQFGRDLQSRGVNYFDLTRIFADNPETLYRDACCHLNGRGYELLAAAMLQRLEPALRRLGQENPAAPVSALAAGRRPPTPDTLLLAAPFQVFLQGDGKYLSYRRAACASGDTEPRFFLHLTPRDRDDLPPQRRQHGFANRDFSFAAAGGRLWQGQCLAQILLPPYPIARLRTGQYTPAAGELWAGSAALPE